MITNQAFNLRSHTRKGTKKSPLKNSENHEPLCTRILQKDFKFKMSNLIERYDGTYDARDHITNYRSAMHLQRTIMCQVFPIYLSLCFKSSHYNFNLDQFMPYI